MTGLLTTTETMDRIGVSRNTLVKWRKRKEGPMVYSYRGRLYYQEHEVEEFTRKYNDLTPGWA